MVKFSLIKNSIYAGIILGSVVFVGIQVSSPPKSFGPVVRVTPPPDDWPIKAKSKLGSRIGGQPGGQARFYIECGYDANDNLIYSRHVYYPFDWVP